MFDFLSIGVRVKNGIAEIRPEFNLTTADYSDVKDVLIRNGDFYAVWVEEKGLWSRKETDVSKIVDRELFKYAEENKDKWIGYNILTMKNGETKQIDKWHRYCQQQMRNTEPEVTLDRYLTFSNTDVKKEDYVSIRLKYPLQKGDHSAYDKLMDKLYEPEERKKIEWAIGCIVAGESEKVQKFVVLYGEPGKGKSTILNLIDKMFAGYCGKFSAQTVGSSNRFALQDFKDNPLIAIDSEAILDKIESNRNLNNIVSHDPVSMEVKNKNSYPTVIRSFLFAATNRPVKITDANSGIMRRLIDVTPTGDTFDQEEYENLMNKIKFEYGAIAWHCREVYMKNKKAYNSYRPIRMITASNDFYNFLLYYYIDFDEQDGVSLSNAWKMYGAYCDMANAPKMNYRVFKEELRNYFDILIDRAPANEEGKREWNYYSGFKREKFFNTNQWKAREQKEEAKEQKGWLEFEYTHSTFDDIGADYPAQYGDDSKTPPIRPWSKVTTKLKDLDTTKLHYVRVPLNHIVIDFDIPDENGNKCLELNMREANKWPKTYAELSKSGQGIHLHYYYTGDPEQLSRNVSDKIEVKVFNGLSSLRRCLSKCNDIPIAELSSGLPLKENKKMISEKVINDAKHLENLIKKSLKRVELTKKGEAKLDEILHTTPCINLIDTALNDAYEHDIQYDMMRWYGRVMKCAMGSSNNKSQCMAKVTNMKWQSKRKIAPGKDDEGMPIVFFDVEVFPNLFVLNWKFRNHDDVIEPVYRMINPKPSEVIDILKYRMVGFNCRRYDNHIVYAYAYLRYTNMQLYKLSQSIILNGKGFIGEAWDLSYTDILDFSSTKQSLKKWEIQMWKKAYAEALKTNNWDRVKRIKHKELGMEWDQPVPEDKWGLVAEYCDNDVIATEMLFEELMPDFTARLIMAELSGGSVNDRTNELTAKMIFGNNEKPQAVFNYRDLSKPVGSDQYQEYRRKFGEKYKFRVFNADGLPEFRDYNGETLPEGWSILPFFRGYTFDNGKSVFMGEEIGEGGKVYSEPGVYCFVLDEDVDSMHPHSAYAERAFGPEYSESFYDLVRIRLAIKRKDYDFVKTYKNGKLAKYLEDDSAAEQLSYALKIAINAVYGQTSAHYDNPFLDIRNKDNFIAKRGALFMTVLKSEVQKRGFTVCHIKTDSIKIPNATPEIKKFVEDFAHEYGYNFSVEDKFTKFLLADKATYIGYSELKNKWVTKAITFQQPYVFKTLFSQEPLIFTDMCETKELHAGDAMYLDMNENLPEGEHNYVFVGKVGLFCPIEKGKGGGELVKKVKGKDGSFKYDSVTGCKGYRWLESETVLDLKKEIDISYYRRFVDEAIDTVATYCDFTAFTS